jgi:hypothetical protein
MKYQALFTARQHEVLVTFLTELQKQLAAAHTDASTKNDRTLSDPLWEGLNETNQLLEVLQ